MKYLAVSSWKSQGSFQYSSCLFLLFFFASVYVRSYVDCMVVQFRLLPFEIICNPVECETFEVQLVSELKTNCKCNNV